jgi:cyclic pyranopterin phosphate synthase
MPKEGLEWLPRDEILSLAEMVRMVGILVGCGIDTVRLAGGEPLVRANVEELVAMIANSFPGVDLSMTTNGFRLAEKAEPLAKAGLRRVILRRVISMDSMRPDRFHEITRRDGLPEVLRGLEAAATMQV